MNFSKGISGEEHIRTITTYNQHKHVGIWYGVSQFLCNASEWHYEQPPLPKATGTEMTEVSGCDKEQEQNQGPCILPSHPQAAGAYGWSSERPLESAKT